MDTRPKAFAFFFACCALPLFLLCAAYGWISARAVEAQLRQQTQRDAFVIAQRVEAALNEREEDLSALAENPSVRLLCALRGQPNSNAGGQTNAPLTAGVSTITAAPGAINNILEDVRRDVGAFLLRNQRYFASVACVSESGQPLFRVEPAAGKAGRAASDADLRFQTGDFPSGSVRSDERVWRVAAGTPVCSSVIHDASGAILRFSIGLRASAEDNAAHAALVADLKFDSLLRQQTIDDAASDTAQTSATPSSSAGKSLMSAPRLLIVLDEQGQIVYHTNDALKHQAIASAMPFFRSIAEAMRAKVSGSGFFYSPEGKRWLAAYRPVPMLGVSLAVAEDYSAATASLRRAFWLSLLFGTLVALIAASLLSRFVGRTKGSIERVTEGALAMAEGDLDRRIEVRSTDDMKLLAETFNQMSERLREQLAREAETKQFESFMRLSAMLTHDLKNAIASLSMIVRNMERQFHRAEFRADAMQSLTGATDKLRVIVAKLSDPVQSMSGEHPLPRPHDLIPIIRRVLARSAEPSAGIYEIETHLPETLVAVIDVERIEKVIENLVLNALEAMGTGGGKLSVEAGTESAREVFFSVRDTGPGMSDEFQRTKLFRAFETTKKRGVGLGLYTCREVIKAHGGRIEVESKRGAGASFRVVLPSETATAVTAVKTQS
ncbi:MAG: ATP-binding protein [Pyrinomonadaceae bacterium]